MKAKYGIGLLIAVIICMALFSGAYYLSYQNLKQQLAEVQEQTEQEGQSRLEEEVTVATEGDASQAFQFYLLPLNGYVVVYLSDKTTVYEYTNISMNHLPEDLRIEIENGKGLATESELYGFLENYSS